MWYQTDGVSRHLPRRVLDAGVDVLQFGGGQGPHGDAGPGSGAAPIDDDHATEHAASWVVVHVAMHHDQASAHGVSNPPSELASDQDESVVHGRAKVVVAPVLDDDGSTAHGPSGHGAGMPVAEEAPVLQGGTKHASCIASVVKGA